MTELDTYDYTNEENERVLYLSGEITEDSVLRLKKEIIKFNIQDDKLEDEYYLSHEEILGNLLIDGDIKSIGLRPFERKPISIFIDSGGGAVYSGLALVNVIKTSNTPITTIVTGKAMSMAFLIAMAGDYRLGYKHSTWMYHDGSFGIWSDTTNIKRELEESNRLDVIYDDMVKDWSYITDEWIEEIKEKRKNYYFGGEEALELGVVDELIDGDYEDEEYEGVCDICGESLDDCECGE